MTAPVRRVGARRTPSPFSDLPPGLLGRRELAQPLRSRLFGLLLGVTLLLAAPAALGGARARAQEVVGPGEGEESVTMTVTALSAVVGPGVVPVDTPDDAVPLDIGLRVLLENDGQEDLTNLRLVVEVGRPITSRSQLREALDVGRITGRPVVRDTPIRDGGDLPVRDIAGATLTVPGTSLGWRPDRQSGGVYPVRIAVQRGTRTLDQVVTAVVFLDEAPSAGRLNTALTWPLDAAPWREPDGTYPAGIDGEIRPGGRLDRILSAIEKHAAAAVTIAPAAHLLEDLSDRADGFVQVSRAADGSSVRTEVPADGDAARRAAGFLQRIREIIAALPLEPVTGPYADADLAGLLASPDPLPAAAGTAVSEAKRRLARLGGRSPDSGVWLGAVPLVPEALDLISDDHLLLPWDALTPPDLAADGDIPPALRALTAPSSRRLTATVADPRLDTLLKVTPTTHGIAIAVQRFVAETAMIFFEKPGTVGRALLVMPPQGWSPDPLLPGPLLNALVAAPWLQLMGAAEQAAALPRSPLDSTLGPPAGARVPAGILGELSDTQLALEALRDAIPDPDEQVDGRSFNDLSDQLLRAPSVWWQGRDLDRAAQLIRDVGATVDAGFGRVAVPVTSQLTLTSDTGVIPVTLQRVEGGAITVRVVLEAAGRLSFPKGEDRERELAPGGNQTVSFDVKALARGRFPVTVIVTDPSGLRVLEEVQMQVRSTAISRPALIIVGGAVVVLLILGALRRRRPSRPQLEVITGSGESQR